MIDKDTFCEQIRLHEKAMYYLAFSLVQNEADAADVIGEAILRAYKNIDGLKSEKAFKPWLLKIIHNTAVEYIRKTQKQVLHRKLMSPSKTISKQSLHYGRQLKAFSNHTEP